MKRAGVTLADVTEAADTLYSQGVNPTIDRIRHHLGETGSNTTIAKYLQNWRSRTLSAANTEPSNTPPDPVQIAVKRVWQEIREGTDAEIEAIKSDTHAIIQEADARLAAAIKESQAIKIEREALQAQVYALQAKSEIQQLDYQQLTTEYRVLEECYRGLEKHCSDAEITMATQQADITRAHQMEVARLNEKLTDQAAAHQRLVDTIKQHAEDERTQHMRETDGLKSSYQQLRKEHELSALQVTEKDKELITLKTEYEAIRRERDALSTQLQEQAKYRDLIEKNNELTKRIWSEVQEIPKVDVGTTYLNELHQHFNQSLLRLDQATVNASSNADLFNQIKSLLKKREAV